jgi:hypothetical protein
MNPYYDIYALVYVLDALDILGLFKLQLGLLINQLYHEILVWVYVTYTFGRSIKF